MTSALMAQFYHHLAAGQGRAEAMKQAMLTVRQTHPHPRHWAPFVVVGNDGPLPGRRGVVTHPLQDVGLGVR